MNDTKQELRQSCRVLVADDNAKTAERIRSILLSGGYRQVEVISSFETFEQLEGYHIAILDIVWPRHARPAYEESPYWGLTALQYLRKNSPQTKVILMSKHLFDLDHIHKIQEADAYFKSRAEASQVLALMSKVFSEANDPVVAETPENHTFILMQKPVDAVTPVPTDKALVAYDYLTLLEQTLLDGRADLFGLRRHSYDDLAREIQELKEEIQKKNSATWKQRLDTLSALASGAKNLLDVINAIRIILPI